MHANLRPEWQASFLIMKKPCYVNSSHLQHHVPLGLLFSATIVVTELLPLLEIGSKEMNQTRDQKRRKYSTATT